MSKPMTSWRLAAADIAAIPTIPPAGPERIASLPRKWWASVRPPEDCMNSSRTPGSSRATWST